MDEYEELLREANHIANHTPNPGRNELCPCGSGKKYKLCHGPLDDAGEPGDELVSSDEEVV